MTESPLRMDKLLLRPEEAAEILSIGRSEVFDLIREGELVSVRIGRLRRIPVSALEAYVERLTRDAMDTEATVAQSVAGLRSIKGGRHGR